MKKLTILVLALWTLNISAQSITINSMIWNNGVTEVNFTVNGITSVTNWEYSTDSGQSWTTLNPVSTSLTNIQINGLSGKNSLVLRTIGANPSGPFTSNTYTTPTNLPVTWAGFDVFKSNNSNVLIWKTASEQNSHYFVPQYSLDLVKWDSIGRIISKGESSSLTEYSFEHTNLPNTNKTIYYRIKQVDLDNTIDYSDITYPKYVLSIVNNTIDNNFEIIKTTEGILIKFNKEQEGYLIDLSGKQFKVKSNEIINIKDGIYILYINNNYSKINIKN